VQLPSSQFSEQQSVLTAQFAPSLLQATVLRPQVSLALSQTPEQQSPADSQSSPKLLQTGPIGRSPAAPAAPAVPPLPPDALLEAPPLEAPPDEELAGLPPDAEELVSPALPPEPEVDDVPPEPELVDPLGLLLPPQAWVSTNPPLATPTINNQCFIVSVRFTEGGMPRGPHLDEWEHREACISSWPPVPSASTAPARSD
jgi:hypothetical protein